MSVAVGQRVAWDGSGRTGIVSAIHADGSVNIVAEDTGALVVWRPRPERELPEPDHSELDAEWDLTDQEIDMRDGAEFILPESDCGGPQDPRE